MDVNKYEIYFDNLLNNMLEGVAIHRLIFNENNEPIDYIVLKINKSCEKILGYSKDIEGKLASEIYDIVPILKQYSNVVINQKPDKFNFFYEKNNKHFNISCAPWDETGFITIFSDITKLINQEKELKKKKKELEKSNETKSVFLSNISHELKTPMTSIIGLSNMLLDDNNEKINSYSFLKSINSNAKYLDELLNNILDYSKIANSEFDILYENFSLFDLFDELDVIFQDINHEKNINNVKLNFIKDKDKKIITDYLRLKQVLFNIISNSIKFTEKGYINITYLLSDNFITFRVEDTGVGIPKDKIKYIFDRFWQCDSTSRKKYKGTGLGLSISKSIIKLLSGNIWVESTINKGSIFYIKISLEEEVEEKNKIRKTQLNFSGKTILILDDIPTEYSVLGIFLKSLNIDILTTYKENEFITKYKEKKDKIDVILIDINLHNENIFELLKKIKAINSNCKIISKSTKKLKNEHVDYNLIKPINKNKLTLILKEIWQKPKEQD